MADTNQSKTITMQGRVSEEIANFFAEKAKKNRRSVASYTAQALEELYERLRREEGKV